MRTRRTRFVGNVWGDAARGDRFSPFARRRCRETPKSIIEPVPEKNLKRPKPTDFQVFFRTVGAMGTVRAQDPQSISRRPTNILIAEDDRPLAAALARILEDNGYDADLVHNGEEAVDYALAGQYDVIILDVMLPRKDGFAITSELRRANLSTPILLLTARGATSDKITSYDRGPTTT